LSAVLRGARAVRP